MGVEKETGGDMMKYKVIWRESIKDLEEAVNQALKDGWKLEGNLVVYERYWTSNAYGTTELRSGTFYYQAMTRKKK